MTSRNTVTKMTYLSDMKYLKEIVFVRSLLVTYYYLYLLHMYYPTLLQEIHLLYFI